jgi:hypothetical protein
MIKGVGRPASAGRSPELAGRPTSENERSLGPAPKLGGGQRWS